MILPDYQGIGLGTRFVDAVGSYYKNLGFDVSIMTSAKNMICGLRKNPNWILARYGVVRKHSNYHGLDANSRFNCITASFFHK